MKSKEVFKDIPGYEGIYQVSDLGNVKSLSRTVVTSRRTFTTKEKLLKLGLGVRGYYQVVLYKNKATKKETRTIHNLVATTFLGYKYDKENLQVIDHINNNKLDNRLVNLQIITTRENSTKDQKGWTSKYIGVYKRGKRWSAEIAINKKSIKLGGFKYEEKAAEAYQEALALHLEGKSIQPIIDKNKRVCSSRYKGVVFMKRTNRWEARMYKNYGSIYIGSFENEYDAHLAVVKYKESIDI